MRSIYFALAGVHFITVAVTGVLWTWIVLVKNSALAPYLREVRIVHLGALYLCGILLGLAYAFDTLHVPPLHQAVFPVGLVALVVLAGVAYYFPRPTGLDPFHYWTHGWAAVVSVLGLLLLAGSLIWTAGVLFVFASG